MPESRTKPLRPARILMYSAYMPPKYSGAALQALTLARQLRQRGHVVEFVTIRWPGLDATGDVDGFPIHRLEAGRSTKHREFRLWWNLARFVASRRRDFDVLHSHGAYYTHSFIGPLARMLGLRSLVKASLANDDLHGLSRSVAGHMHRLMLGRIDACVGISRDLVDEFRAGGVAPGRIHHLPNGVDTARFHPADRVDIGARRARLNLPVDQPVALYLGVLDERKNILWLAEQWVANDSFGMDALLVAVGPQSREDPKGLLRQRLLALAQAHPRRFVLHDFSPDVLPYYQAADALILPSVNEGLPNVVLEAMACGLPSIAARTSGSRELVIEGETGHTYAPGEPAALEWAVRECLHPERGPAMGRRAREVAEQSYAIERIADRYQALYAGLVTERAGHATTTPQRPRRIVFVENGIGYGGAVTCLRHLVRALDRRQYEPIVITGQRTGPYQGIAADARWLCIPDRRLDVAGLRRHLESHRWPDRVPGLRFVARQVLARLDDLVNFAPLVAQLVAALLRLRPDVVHVNNEPLCNRAAVVAAWLLRIPLVSHVRGDQFGSRSMMTLFKLPDRFIPVSRWIATSIEQLGVPPVCSTMIYDGLDFSRLDPQTDGTGFRARHGWAEDDFVVGLPGVLIAWKGQALLLEAARLLVNELPRLHIAIVGGTPDECLPFEQELRDYVALHGLTGRVTFTGHVDDMTQAYAGLDLVVSASTAPEPLGMVVVEAMAMQRPVIAPAHGGALEVVDHGRTGLLFAPNDARALAAEIRRMATDTALRRQMAANAREAVIDRFSIQTSAQAVQRVYEGLLA